MLTVAMSTSRRLCRIVCLSLILLSAGYAQARVIDAVAIMRQPADENMCALTFDDGPGPFTAHLLDSLQAEGVHATFFVLGQQVRRHPELVQRMLAEGHEVGSHSYSHPNMRKLAPEAQFEQLDKTNQLLREIGGDPKYFRPPYGKFDKAIAAMADTMGMSIVLWSADSMDWKRRPVDYSKMASATGRPSAPGHMRGVFLFHDIHKGTVEDLPRILSDLRAGGCRRFVTISEYMLEPRREAPVLAGGELPPSPAVPSPEEQKVPLPGAQQAKNQKLQQEHAAIAASSGARADVPLARSSRPWFWPGLFRSGT